MSRIKSQNSSYGLIAVKKEQNQFKFLMIQRPYTYEFKHYVHGEYKNSVENKVSIPDLKTELSKLFDGMTHNEKILIRGCDYSHCWYNIHKRYITNSNSDPYNKVMIHYNKKKNIFENTAKLLGQSTLIELIKSSKDNENMFIYPRGRKDKEYESDLSAAIREFREETLIANKDIKIINEIKPFVDSYTSWNETYKQTFYVVELSEDVKLNQYCNDYEVAKIEWLSKKNITEMLISEDFKKTTLTIMNIIIKKYKNYLKKRNVLS